MVKITQVILALLLLGSCKPEGAEWKALQAVRDDNAVALADLFVDEANVSVEDAQRFISAVNKELPDIRYPWFSRSLPSGTLVAQLGDFRLKSPAIWKYRVSGASGVEGLNVSHFCGPTEKHLCYFSVYLAE